MECGLAARTRIHPPPNWRIPILATIVVLPLLAAGIAVALVTLLGNDTTTPASTTVTVPAGTPGVTQTVPTPGATPPTTTPGAATPGTTTPGTTTPSTTTPGAPTTTPGTTTPGATTTTPPAGITTPDGTTTPGAATTTPRTATNATGAAGSRATQRHGMVLRIGGKTVTIPAGAGSPAP